MTKTDAASAEGADHLRETARLIAEARRDRRALQAFRILRDRDAVESNRFVEAAWPDAA
jgi:hypothetical protein